MRTVDDIVGQLPSPATQSLPAPAYTGTSSVGVGLAVESMRRHTSDEGWQVFAGLQHAGYTLAGHDLPVNETRVSEILRRTNPGVVVVQDKKEWDTAPKDFREPLARFTNIETLRDRTDVFKVGLLRDAHQRPAYHRHSFDEMGTHAFLIFYHPRIVCHLAPYLRPQHLIRSYHSVDPALVPDYSPEGRQGSLLSGAVSGAYPLRQRLIMTAMPGVTYLRHPGYHRDGSATPGFLQTLSRFKVAICTSSVYGYALRKLIEATACGCVVLTDLPHDEILPGGIDENLVRIPPTMDTHTIGAILADLCAGYDPERQRHLAQRAKEWYDYRAVGSRLVADIEAMRRGYNL